MSNNNGINKLSSISVSERRSSLRSTFILSLLFSSFFGLFSAPASSTWIAMSAASLGDLVQCNSDTGTIFCLEGSSSVSWTTGDNTLMTVRNVSNGQNYTGRWIGLYGSFSGTLGKGNPNGGNCLVSGCSGGFVIGTGGSFGIPGLAPSRNLGSRSPGTMGGTAYFHGVSPVAPGLMGSSIGSVPNSSVASFSIPVSDATWVLVVDGPNGNYTGPFTGTFSGYSVSDPIPYIVYVCYDNPSTGPCSPSNSTTLATVATGSAQPPIYVPPEVVDPEPITCEFDMPDIDFGQVSAGTTQEQRQEYFSSVCSDTASVTLKITDTSGRTGPYTFAGGALSVIFPGSGSSSYTFSVPGGVTDTTRVNAVLSGETVSGTYNLPMVVTAEYN
ncbi:hypothetical protein AB7179_19065 [Providencia manganoxydans]|uniref:hypothetical protein n=1 Tax=Providencia manganoxydans TaxID=2923283 RepID=UPI002853E460|nr:hypothetical protein [Providencia stuartii]